MHFGRSVIALLMVAASCRCAFAATVQDYGFDDAKLSTLFGYEVECVGDLDSDGTEDIAVAAPRAGPAEAPRGVVLLLSGASGKVIATLHGPATCREFGWGITCLRKRVGKQSGLLAVEGVLDPAKPSDRVSWVYDIDTQKLIGNLSCGSFLTTGDVDADGVADFLGHDNDSSVWRWFSGKSFRPLERSSIGGFLRNINNDFDGDGVLDVLECKPGPSSTVTLRSLKSGSRLTDFELGPDASYSFGTGIRIGLKADGQPCVLFNVLDPGEEVARLRAFSAVTGKSVLSSDPVPKKNGDERYLKCSLRAAPDLNGDGVSDFLSMRTPFIEGEVCAHSGKTLQRLWIAHDAVEEEHHSAAFLARPASEDEGSRYFLAVGRVHCVPGLHLYGMDGEVVILDARTGAILHRWSEGAYLAALGGGAQDKALPAGK